MPAYHTLPPGEEFTDTVSLGNLTVANQSIGVATESQGFAGVDGILGRVPTVQMMATVDELSFVVALAQLP